MTTVPNTRIAAVHQAPVRPEGEYVLYWMTAFRRTGWNFALERAIEWCRKLHKPVLVLEGIRIGYRWACDRFHRFLLDGMADNAERFARAGAAYYAYLEPRRGAAHGLLAALAARSCVVVTDDYPEFFHPFAVQAAAPQVPVRFERVDSNGLLPMRVAGRTFTAARFFRLALQRSLREHLVFPAADPLLRPGRPRLEKIPRDLAQRWSPASARLLCGGAGELARLAIDHHVGPVETVRGGSCAAAKALEHFLQRGLKHYDTERNNPHAQATSGLSSYLHFGHLSTHEVVHKLAAQEGWSADRLARKSQGGSRRWWGLSEPSEAFVDQLVTWRELGFNFCAYRDDAADFDSLPTWARRTLEAHASDRREAVYDQAAFEAAATHDPVWNAAQRQLVREGRIYGYLRMLWGKKVLEWSRSPREALEILIELNNKYALDGRDPNSYSGILWIFGRYDRPWGPQRPVLGTIRFMSSTATRKKLHLDEYLRRFGSETTPP